MKPVLTLLFVSLFYLASAQNLVLNPGLDNYNTCPGFGQFSGTYITNWNKPSIASSDYYHFTCPGINPTLQFPRSGEGYAGIIAYNFGQEYREYITGTLASPLVAGQTYEVEFWVSLHNGYIQAINEMGAFLSAAPPGPFPNVLHIAVQPQIENTASALSDTANWRRVWGNYTATGGEQYITIGNFRPDSLTTITQPGTSGSFGAYYFVDDVSVTAVSVSGTTEISGKDSWKVNYEHSHLIIKSDDPSNAKKGTSVRVTDITGGTKLIFNYTGSECRYPVSLTSGIYVILIGNEYVKKLLIVE